MPTLWQGNTIYNEAEKRNIKGTATPEEEIILKEEGVQFFKVPVIKKILS